MEYSLPPQKLGKTTLVEHGVNTLENVTVECFSNSIVLGGIVCGKTLFGSLGLKVSRKVLIQIFFPSIRT